MPRVSLYADKSLKRQLIKGIVSMAIQAQDRLTAVLHQAAGGKLSGIVVPYAAEVRMMAIIWNSDFVPNATAIMNIVRIIYLPIPISNNRTALAWTISHRVCWVD